ncbi:MAG: class II aldolase/adducin family protein [Atribacterota bacterium]|nr:class II aldolase/adducin family protein [Atribacterota bacterium]
MNNCIEERLLQKFVSYVRLTWDRQLTESTGGNMSIMLNDRIYITPSNFIKHFFTKEDIVVTDLNGKQLEGKYKPSSEIKMHIKIYQNKKDIKSIFHAHPRNVLLCAINNLQILLNTLPEALVILEKIAYLPYCKPGTELFAEKFVKEVRDGYNVFIMENHGATTCGSSIETAYARMETLETSAYLTVMQAILGKKPNIIPVHEVKKILK